MASDEVVWQVSGERTPSDAELTPASFAVSGGCRANGRQDHQPRILFVQDKV